MYVSTPLSLLSSLAIALRLICVIYQNDSPKTVQIVPQTIAVIVCIWNNFDHCFWSVSLNSPNVLVCGGVLFVSVDVNFHQEKLSRLFVVV